MLSTDVLSDDSAPVSERRLAANRANAQLSTGPRTEEGKAKSSLNAVKTGLCGRTILFADEEEAAQYRAHTQRLLEWWKPVGPEEHALVQVLIDTQWRLEAIPGLESALYARARLRGEERWLPHDSGERRLLLDADTEVAEAKTLQNLRLHERRLHRQLEANQAKLESLRQMRFDAEEEQQAEKEEKQRRQEQARKQAERRKAKEAATTPTQPESVGKLELTPNGFEFSTVLETGKPTLTLLNQEE